MSNSEGTSARDIGHSLVKTITIVTGDVNLGQILSGKAYPTIIFFFFASIGLMVLLIAIAVSFLAKELALGNVAEISGKAELHGLISKTKLIAYVENVVVGSPTLQRRWCCRYVEIIPRLNVISHYVICHKRFCCFLR